MNKPEKVMKPCERCHGTGQIITGGHQSSCHECAGKGYFLVDKEAYYRELRREVQEIRGCINEKRSKAISEPETF